MKDGFFYFWIILMCGVMACSAIRKDLREIRDELQALRKQLSTQTTQHSTSNK